MEIREGKYECEANHLTLQGLATRQKIMEYEGMKYDLDGESGMGVNHHISIVGRDLWERRKP